MRIGIVTDVHDEAALLARALADLRAEAVDAVVSLGDTSDLYGKWQNVAGVAGLLEEHGAVGVWGNHDFGLCRDVSDLARSRFSARALTYLATMRPRLDLGGCHFTHVEPWLDPEKVEDLWTCFGPPDDPERLAKSFDAFPHRAAFLGHYHRWLAMTEGGRVEWDGTAPLHFEPDKRYLVVVAPLFGGEFAVIDTDRWVLEPRKLPPHEKPPS